MKYLHIIEVWFVGGKPAKFKKTWLAKDSKKGDFQKTAWVFASDDKAFAPPGPEKHWLSLLAGKNPPDNWAPNYFAVSFIDCRCLP